MAKTDYLKFREAIETVGKTYFSQHDLRKFYKGKRESLKVLLSRWVRKKLIYSLGLGFYAFNLTKVDYLRLSRDFDQTSYISFEYALYFHGLINQVPSVITLATKKKSRIVRAANWTFEYTHLKSDLFFGYEFKNKIYIAQPEKALADLIYLTARGKRIVELDNLEKGKIKRRELHKIFKKFPGYVIEKAKKFGLV